MTLSIVSVVLLATSALACGPGYDTWYDGYCYRDQSSFSGTYDQASKQCAIDGTLLPSIHSAEENKYVHDVAQQDGISNFFIGLKCVKNAFVWEDGSNVTYTNFKTATECNTGATSTRWILNSDYSWVPASAANGVVCKQEFRSNSNCDEFEYYDELRGKTCYKLYTSGMSWDDAEKDCQNHNAMLVSIHNANFNSFVRRSAVGASLVDGVHIGLRKDENDDDFKWIDGSKFDYHNWASNFPQPQLGSCVAIETSFLEGQWVNSDCSTTNLPYMCTKNPVSKPIKHEAAGCPRLNEFASGKDVYSPSFPNAPGKAECDYILLGSGSSTKIQIEIVQFETNKCCETLDVITGVVGHNVFTTLSGYIAPGTKIIVDSNTVRLHWNSTYGENVRGWHIITTAL